MVGPQGGGNHMFSKVFASSNKIGGWKDLNTHYWKGHHTEPFADIWSNPHRLKKFDFSEYDYWVASTSIPCVYKGHTVVHNPLSLFHYAWELDIECQIGVITRDINILKHQQKRVRGNESLRQYQNIVTSLMMNNVPFVTLSHESLILLGQSYIDHICYTLDFPRIILDDELLENANEKYIHPIDSHWLDTYVKIACEESKK